MCKHLTHLFHITEHGACAERRFQSQTEQLIVEKTQPGVLEKEKERVEKEESIYLVPNGFSRAELYSNSFGYHALFPMDTLHTVAHGVCDIILFNALLVYAKIHKPNSTAELDRRFGALLPARDADVRLLHYRSFRYGVTNMSIFTADDMISILQQMQFVVGTGTEIILKTEFYADAFVKACFSVKKNA